MSLATAQGVPGKFDLGVLKAAQEDTSGILATVTADQGRVGEPVEVRLFEEVAKQAANTLRMGMDGTAIVFVDEQQKLSPAASSGPKLEQTARNIIIVETKSASTKWLFVGEPMDCDKAQRLLIVAFSQVSGLIETNIDAYFSWNSAVSFYENEAQFRTYAFTNQGEYNNAQKSRLLPQRALVEGTNDSKEKLPMINEPYIGQDGAENQLERIDAAIPNDQCSNDIQIER